ADGSLNGRDASRPPRASWCILPRGRRQGQHSSSPVNGLQLSLLRKTPDDGNMGALRGPRPSRHRYHDFRRDYRQQRLDDAAESGSRPEAESPDRRRGKRREYVREYLRWLRPHRFAVAPVLLVALLPPGLQVIEPLFIRFIIDRVLLNTALDTGSRLAHLHRAGLVYLAVIFASSLFGVLKDYRQRLLNVRVMLSLRQSLFYRLLTLPLPRLWDMKTGGILSRLTGDIDTTTGLMQMAVVSPSVSIIRLAI